jgi:hypothetical protein
MGRQEGGFLGRQIQILMNRDDERTFLEFLRGTAPIQLYDRFAPISDALGVDDFADEPTGHSGYLAHNQTFPWVPEYGKVRPRSVDPDKIDWAYISNAGQAPFLEIDRSLRGKPGRLYWARDFSAPNGLAYDAEAFSKWVDRVWRWCRANGRKLSANDPSAPYIFPGAMEEKGG